EEYRAQYFEKWRLFLVSFPRGEALPREQRRQLAVKLSDEHSPYNRILDGAFEQIKPLLPAVLPGEGDLSGAAEGRQKQPVSWLEQINGTMGQLWAKLKQTTSQLWAKGGTGSVTGGVKDAPPATVAEPTLPNWVRVLHHYIRSDTRKAYLEALK